MESESLHSELLFRSYVRDYPRSYVRDYPRSNQFHFCAEERGANSEGTAKADGGNITTAFVSGYSTLRDSNPFRYRGYYYDTETGFYYLNSRYYDPVTEGLSVWMTLRS